MTTTKVVFLVLPRVHMLDFSGALQTFQEAIEYGASIQLDYCSYQDGLVSSSEFPLGKLKRFDEVSLHPGDYLFVPGSEVDYLLSTKLGSEKKLKNWVLSQYKMGVNIASVCTGAFFLALLGLLNGRKCTTHWKRIAQLKKNFPSANVVEDVLFIEDGGVYTSAGVTAVLIWHWRSWRKSPAI